MPLEPMYGLGDGNRVELRLREWQVLGRRPEVADAVVFGSQGQHLLGGVDAHDVPSYLLESQSGLPGAAGYIEGLGHRLIEPDEVLNLLDHRPVEAGRADE